MISQMKHPAPAAGALVLSLALAGCGGSSTTSGARLEADTSAQVMAATEAARTMERAILAEAGGNGNADAGLGGTGATTYSMTVSRTGAGAMAAIVDSGMAGDDDPQFAQSGDPGGGAIRYVRRMGADGDSDMVEEVVVFSTDIEAPVATPFAEVDGQFLNVDLEPYEDADDNGTAWDDYTAFGVFAELSTVRALIEAAVFAGPAGTTLTFRADDPETLDDDEAYETAGAYNGAPGTYRCHSYVDCTVTLGANDTIAAMSGDWVFIPDAGSTADVPDKDYLYYGFWLKKTTDPDGAVAYDEVETFAYSSVDASSGTELDDVEGSATYEGGATGVYVRTVYNADRTVDRATAGHFTANVRLMAYFGGMGISEDKRRTVTGAVSNFVLSGGESNDWSVALEGARASGSDRIEGKADGGGAEADWSGRFHGATPLTIASDDPASAREAPDVVVGEFNANFDNGSAAGAFGARKR